MAQICELVRVVGSGAAPTRSSRATTRSSATTISRPGPPTSWPSRARALAARRAPDTGRGARARVHARRTGTPSVDVVIDDMPFLVDSLTMALDRHDLGVHLVVHPILRVRRSADGELRGIVGDDERDATSSKATTTIVLRVVDAHRGRPRDERRDPRHGARRVLDACSTTCAAATSDWLKMLDARARSRPTSSRPRRRSPPTSSTEGTALLQWLADQHFTFLGYREYDLVADDRLVPVPGIGSGCCATRPSSRRRASPRCRPTSAPRRARRRCSCSRRRTRARRCTARPTSTTSAIKRYDAHGKVDRRAPVPRPVHRRALHGEPVRRSRAAPQGRGRHRARRVPAREPRSEGSRCRSSRRTRATTCSRSTSTISSTTAMGILRLQERRRVRLFVHREPYGRFVSCLVFIPRDRYTTQRARAASRDVLIDGVRRDELRVEHAPVGVGARPAALRAAPRRATLARPSTCRSSKTRRRGRAARGSTTCATRSIARTARRRASTCCKVWANAFPAAYQDDFDAAEALADLAAARTARRDRPLVGAAHDRRRAPRPQALRHRRAAVALRGAAPARRTWAWSSTTSTRTTLTPNGLDPRWIKWFRLRAPAGTVIDPAALRLFEEAFLAVVDGRAEDDGFNRLVLAAGLAWREVALLARVLPLPAPDRHAGSARRTSRTRSALHADIARRLVELFVARLDPWVANGDGRRRRDRAPRRRDPRRSSTR